MKLLEQLIQTEKPKKSNARVGRTKAIHPSDELLFICIFLSVKKKLKRRNQFAVAAEIQKLFKNTFSIHYSDYLIFDEYIKAYDIKIEQLKVDINIKESTYKHYLIYRPNYNSESYKYALRDINDYLKFATPAAIVQLKKRLILKNSWWYGLDYLRSLYGWH